MTFSLLGRCGRTGRLGIAVTSSSPAVAARCAAVRAGVGVASSQNVTDPRLRGALLDALADGDGPEAALRSVAASAPHAEFRQLALLDADGRGAAWSGTHALGVAGERTGDGWVVAGNLLASLEVLDAVATRFVDSAGAELEARLLDGLAAGLDAGGEAGPLHSAGLLVTDATDRAVTWPVTDLRVDWAGADAGGPIAALTGLWERWAPQRDDYVLRALAPAAAPGYGVPGDP